MATPQNVVIVGRINVGKSSLFNRLTDTTKALVSDVEGTTRDYNIAKVEWRKKSYNLIDTGGINIATLTHSIQSLLDKKKSKKNAPADSIEQAIVDQTKEAIKKATMLLFVVDAKAGVLPEDTELALVLKKLKIPTLVVANKADSMKQRNSTAEFYQLGFDQVVPVSAANGSGTGDLLDILDQVIKGKPGRPSTKAPDKEASKAIKVAIVGKPNVGKSSLVNAILGEKRVIVSEIAHTTREPQDTEFMYKGHKILLIDTAGLRKEAKRSDKLEKLSAKKTEAMIRMADVVVFMTESDKTLVTQDHRLAGMIKDCGAGVILASNKWDLLQEKSTVTGTEMLKYYQQHFPFISFAPLLFLSAKNKKNIDDLLEAIIDVQTERTKMVDKDELADMFEKLKARHRPVQSKGTRRPNLMGLEQVSIAPPTFELTVRKDDTVHFSYLRFIENQLRYKFNFQGTPIKITLKRKR